jgi:hypothetical protein
MAVDSRSKRASSVSIMLPFVLAPVLPDGTIAQADRQHIAFSYSGILASAAEALAEALYLLSKIELTRNLLSAVELTRNLLSEVATTMNLISEVD